MYCSCSNLLILISYVRDLKSEVKSTYLLHKRHHEAKESAINMNVESVLGVAYSFQNFKNQVEIVHGSLDSCPCGNNKVIYLAALITQKTNTYERWSQSYENRSKIACKVH